MAEPGKISFSDYARRHPERAVGDPNQQPPVECPICGYANCTTPDEHARQVADETARRAARRRPPAPRERREDPSLPPASDAPVDDLERLVVAKQDHHEDFLYPGTVTPTQILRITKGQRLPLREALEFGIEWQEQDGPESFQVGYKKGVPTVLDRGGIQWENEPHVIRAHYDGDETEAK